MPSLYSGTMHWGISQSQLVSIKIFDREKSIKIFFQSWCDSHGIRVGCTMLKIRRGTPCQNIHPQVWYTPFLKTLTAKWSLYRRGCGYRTSVLDFLELYLRRDLEHNVTSLLPNQLFQKVEDWRAVATAATVPRPFCCQSFQKCGVLCLRMNILTGRTTTNFQHGTPNAT